SGGGGPPAAATRVLLERWSIDFERPPGLAASSRDRGGTAEGDGASPRRSPGGGARSGASGGGGGSGSAAGSGGSGNSGDIMKELKHVLKRVIILLRTLYAYARVLPAHGLQRRINRAARAAAATVGPAAAFGGFSGAYGGAGGGFGGSFGGGAGAGGDLSESIGFALYAAGAGGGAGCSFSTGDDGGDNSSGGGDHPQQYAFQPVATPFGQLHISVEYRAAVGRLQASRCGRGDKTRGGKKEWLQFRCLLAFPFSVTQRIYPRSVHREQGVMPSSVYFFSPCTVTRRSVARAFRQQAVLAPEPRQQSFRAADLFIQEDYVSTPPAAAGVNAAVTAATAGPDESYRESGIGAALRRHTQHVHGGIGGDNAGGGGALSGDLGSYHSGQAQRGGHFGGPVPYYGGLATVGGDSGGMYGAGGSGWDGGGAGGGAGAGRGRGREAGGAGSAQFLTPGPHAGRRKSYAEQRSYSMGPTGAAATAATAAAAAAAAAAVTSASPPRWYGASGSPAGEPHSAAIPIPGHGGGGGGRKGGGAIGGEG
ncbi:unnamed protein product, partial [Phaeothamnion confervicola]